MNNRSLVPQSSDWEKYIFQKYCGNTENKTDNSQEKRMVADAAVNCK